MSVGDKKLNIYLKKFLAQQEMVDNFQNLVQKYTEDLYKRVFPQSGVYRGGFLSSSLNDTIDISLPLEATNSQGKDIELDPSDATQVKFENNNGDLYYVGLNHTIIPDEVEVNTKTGKLKYRFFKEIVGYRADPNSVVDDGDGTMTVIVDSVFESNVDHSGRTVRIFLKSVDDGGTIGPLSLIQPFEDVIVQYDGTNNYIETTTALGQNAVTISTSTNDYEVVAIGVTIRKNTDLRTVPTSVFLGIITGNGPAAQPTVFDQTDRLVLSASSGGGPGSGIAAQLFQVLTGGGTLEHDPTTLGTISWSANLKYRPFGSGDELTINASSVALADDEVAYIIIPDPFIGGVVSVNVSPRTSAGLASTDRYWLFHRDGDKIHVRTGLQLEQGEKRQLEDIVINANLYFGTDDKLRHSNALGNWHFDANGGTDNGSISLGSTIYYGDPTNNDKIVYSGGLLSVLLGNSVLGSAISAGRHVALGSLVTDTAFEASVTGDADLRWEVESNGVMRWGDGTNPADTDLFREAAGILSTTNILKSLLGQLTLNDINLTRSAPDTLTLSANNFIINDIIFNRVNASLISISQNFQILTDLLTINDIDISRTSTTLLTISSNIRSALGTLTLNDIDIVRESASVIGILSDIRSSTGIFRAGDLVNNDFIGFVEGGTPYWQILTNGIERFRVDENGDSLSARDTSATRDVKATRDSLTQAGTSYVKPSDGTDVTGVNASLNEVYDRTRGRDLLKITANNAPDVSINIAGASITLASGETVGLINQNSTLVNFAGSAVNFGTGVVGVGANFTPYTPSGAGRFFKYGIILKADDTIEIVLPVDDAATPAAATAPELKGGIPVGIIIVESISVTPGDVQPIIEDDIIFFGASGSGGGATLVIEAPLANNQSLEANVTGFLVNQVENKGFSSDMLIKREHSVSEGTQDNEFYTQLGTAVDDGVVIKAIHLNDGSVILIGSFTSFNGESHNRIVKLKSNGEQDLAFNYHIGSGVNNTVLDCAVLSDGSIILVGIFSNFNGNVRNGIVGLNSNGVENTTFATNTGTGAQTINGIVALSDDSMILVGNFTAFNSIAANNIVKLNPGGVVIASFNTNIGTGLNGVATTVNLQSDESIIIGGDFTQINGTTSTRVAKASSSGVPDLTFASNIGTGANFPVNSLDILSDDSIILGGDMTLWQATTVPYLVKLSSVGIFDVPFFTNIGTGPDAAIYGVYVNPSDLIYISGTFANFDGNARISSMRLLSNGTDDATFNAFYGTGFNNVANFTNEDVSGNIFVAGGFTSFDGNTRNRIVKIWTDIVLEYTKQFSFHGYYKNNPGYWNWGEGTSIGDDVGIDFNMNNSGQLLYTSTNIIGTPVTSFIRYILRGL